MWPLNSALAQTKPELNISTPQSDKSSDDVQVVIQNSVSSRLIYTTYDETKPTRPTSLTIGELNPVGDQGNLKPKFSFYPTTKAGDRVLFDPLLSPGGRYALLQFGTLGSNLVWSYMYVIDIQTNQLKKISPRRINYDVASWSPDGNYLAFIEGGDAHGDAYF